MGVLFPVHILRTLESSTPEEEVAKLHSDAKLVDETTTDEKLPVVEPTAPKDNTPEDEPAPEQPMIEVPTEEPPEAQPEEDQSSPPDRKPKIELIKDEAGPREPSKKLPSIFYDD